MEQDLAALQQQIDQKKRDAEALRLELQDARTQVCLFLSYFCFSPYPLECLNDEIGSIIIGRNCGGICDEGESPVHPGMCSCMHANV